MTRWCDYKITFGLDRDVSDMRVFITFRQGDHVVCEFSDVDDNVAVDGDTVAVTISQSDTALFTPSPAAVQLNFISGKRRMATDIMKIHVYDNLCEHGITEDAE